MNEQELNMKIAEWWMPEGKRLASIPSTDDILWGTKEKQYWVNFPKSLDACFKWLVPKLDKCSISKNKALGINVDCPNRITVEVMIDKSYRTKGGLLVRNELWGKAMDNSAPLAFCLAIENLIDKEV